jgi:hypothetical protein
MKVRLSFNWFSFYFAHWSERVGILSGEQKPLDINEKDGLSSTKVNYPMIASSRAVMLKEMPHLLTGESNTSFAWRM